MSWLGSTHPSPYELTQRVMTGALDYTEAPKAIQSVLRLAIYHEAKRILALPFDDRKSALQGVTVTIRTQVETEIRRLWSIKR